jgi:ribose transport system substrate-binding protein
VLKGEKYEKRTPVETFLINKDNVEKYGLDGWQ